MKIGLSAQLGIGLLLLFAVLGILGVQSAKTPLPQSQATAKTTKSVKSPYLRLEKQIVEYGFYTSQGEWISSRTNQGKIILLYFWATWCQPCREMVPKLNTLWHKYKDNGFSLVMVSLDGESEKIQAFMESKKVALPYTYLPHAVITDSELVAGIPTMYLLSSTGRILKKTEGIISSEQVELEVLGYLKKR